MWHFNFLCIHVVTKVIASIFRINRSTVHSSILKTLIITSKLWRIYWIMIYSGHITLSGLHTSEQDITGNFILKIGINEIQYLKHHLSLTSRVDYCIIIYSGHITLSKNDIHWWTWYQCGFRIENWYKRKVVKNIIYHKQVVVDLLHNYMWGSTSKGELWALLDTD